MLSHHHHIWELALKKINIGQLHSHTPLLFNNHMPELLTIPDPILLAAYGIVYLYQVMTTSGPKTFQTLKDKFSLPNHLLFRYLQLRHALQTQFRNLNVSLVTHPVLDIILGTEPSKLISNLYSTIHLPTVTALAYKAKTAQELDIGAIEDKDWGEILKGTKTAFPKMLDRLMPRTRDVTF